MKDESRTAMEMGLEAASAPAPADAPAVPAEKSAPPPSADGVVSVTPAAVERIRALIAEQDIPAEEHNLRIFVQAGGCSGFSYGLAFDRRNDDDAVTESEGVRILVDAKSLPHLKGIVVDFVDTVEEQGFKIQNPNAKSSCGCGESFQA